MKRPSKLADRTGFSRVKVVAVTLAMLLAVTALAVADPITILWDDFEGYADGENPATPPAGPA